MRLQLISLWTSVSRSNSIRIARRACPPPNKVLIGSYNVRRAKLGRTRECGAQAPSLACGNTRKSRSSKSCVSIGDGWHKARRSKCAGRNATSVKAIEPRETRRSVVGRDGIVRMKALREFLISQMRAPPPPGSKTTACMEGSARELGSALKSRKWTSQSPKARSHDQV